MECPGSLGGSGSGFVGGGPEERLAFPPGRYAQRPFCFRHSAKSSRFFSFVAG